MNYNATYNITETKAVPYMDYTGGQTTFVVLQDQHKDSLAIFLEQNLVVRLYVLEGSTFSSCLVLFHFVKSLLYGIISFHFGIISF